MTRFVFAAENAVGTRALFVALVVALLVIAVGHLYVFADLNGLYAGLPLWIWVQLVVVFVMMGLAWIAVGLVSTADGGR